MYALFSVLSVPAISIGGTVPIVYSYFSEFLQMDKRGEHLSWLCMFWMIGGIYASFTAWGIIPRYGMNPCFLKSSRVMHSPGFFSSTYEGRCTAAKLTTTTISWVPESVFSSPAFLRCFPASPDFNQFQQLSELGVLNQRKHLKHEVQLKNRFGKKTF